MLAASGQLDLRAPTGSPVADLGEGFVAATFTTLKVRGGAPGGGVTAALPDFKIEDFNHRSVYLPVLRDLVVEPLALFDFAEASLVTGQRQETSVPAQALYLMNSPLVLKQSDAMAARLLAAQSLTPAQRIGELFQWTLGRLPTPAESRSIQEFSTRFVAAQGKSDPRDPWIALCQSLIASAEFRYLN